jgi:hypothetical protein
VFRIIQILERACSIPESLRALLEQHGLLTWVRAALSDGGSGSASGSGRAPLSQLQPLLSLLRKVAELLPEYHSSRVDERLVRKEGDAKAAKEQAGKDSEDAAAEGVADMDSSEDGEDDESAGDRIELKRKSPLDRVRGVLRSSPSMGSPANSGSLCCTLRLCSVVPRCGRSFGCACSPSPIASVRARCAVATCSWDGLVVQMS